MVIFRVALFIFILGLPTSLPGQQPSPPNADAVLQRLEAEIGRAARLSEGTVGVSALRFESGQRVSLNSKERFPMASTYKVPIAVQVLALVDRQALSLGQMIDVKPTISNISLSG